MIRVCLFDAPCSVRGADAMRQRLVAVADFSVASVYAVDGASIHFPLRFHAVTRADDRRKPRIPDGSLVVAAQRIPTSTMTNNNAKKFRLDVECGRIARATSLATSFVKKLFYTIHGIVDNVDSDADSWTLLFRSDPVEMIHRKRDGGSMQYNHFSGVRLRGIPAGGDQVASGSEKRRLGEDENATAAGKDGKDDKDTAGGLLRMFGKALGVGAKSKRFFSLPGADVYVLDEGMRLKLSIWEDNGMKAGYDLIADTLFTMAELKRRRLGDSSPIKVHANVVGKAVLKYVESTPDPKYFCLSLRMQG